MEALRYILFLYIIIGFIVTGGLVFQKPRKTNVFLAIFILVFTLKQLSFLYETSGVLQLYPQFFMITFPLSFLFGPALFYHFKFLADPNEKITSFSLFHLIPFAALTVVTIYLFSMSGEERVLYIRENLHSLIVPVNYIKVAHILAYGLVIFYTVGKRTEKLTSKAKSYMFTVLFIYTISAFLQASFYASFLRFKYFIVYHVVASTLVLFIGYMLYFHPNILEKIKSKYSKSSLNNKDKSRIFDKIENYLSNPNNIRDQELNLGKLARNIEEKKYHISQTLSEKYSTSFNDLINEKRIQYSKTLLLNSDYDHLKILAVALESGFTNKTTFNRAFVKFNACTPSEFRNKNRIQII